MPTIRPATPADRPALIALMRRASLLWDDTRAVLLANLAIIDVPPEQIEAGQVFLAENAAGDLLGFAVLLPRPDGDAELDGLFRSGSRAWQFAPTISLPIFDGGQRQANLNLQAVRQNMAVVQYEKTIETAMREVLDALSSRTMLEQQLVVLTDQRAALKERARLARLRYDQGASPYLDVLDAERDLLSAEQQLVQGRDKALEGGTPDEMLERFAGFPEIQVIDLDAAIGNGANDALVEHIAAKAKIRAGGGVRTVERAKALLAQGAYRVIVGTSAFQADGPNHKFLGELAAAIGPEKILLAVDSKNGRIVVKGWRESTNFTAEEMVKVLEPYCGGYLCTYVDKEGMMQGTDLDWFARLRAATTHEITAAGGITTLDDIRALDALNIHSALGMAIYTGRIRLDDIRPRTSC